MDFSLIINTVKGFLTKPGEEWQKIKAQQYDKQTLLMKILVPILIIYVVATLLGTIISLVITPYVLQFLGFGRILMNAVVSAILAGVVAFGLIYGGTFVLYGLADNFGAKKDDSVALKVMVFANIIMLVSSVALIIPYIGRLVQAAGSIYSLVLLFWGMRDLLEPPQDKMVMYYVVTLLILIAAGVVLFLLVGVITSLLIGGAMIR
ncbi:MAG: YIP1 family protein [Spirochaetes bacterium]|nr:YIP1 family protein [Spirochaetota bacterium]